jgi:hypothetical protein
MDDEESLGPPTDPMIHVIKEHHMHTEVPRHAAPPVNPIDIDIDESELSVPDETAPDEPDEQAKPKKKRKFFHWPPTKKQVIIFSIVVAVLLIGGGLAYGLGHHSTKPKGAIKKATIVIKSTPPAPTTVASTLTGLQVSPSVNQQPVTGVMIENSTTARPQSGLAQAGVVFEALAEGGITRFLALYQAGSASYIGPIRSARPYFLQWDLGFDAPLAHVGGSPEAITDIGTWGVKDLDQYYNGSYYTRISSRQAPHNVYTSIAELNDLEQSKGYDSSNFTGFPRKADSPTKTPTAAAITFNPAGPDFTDVYNYDSSTDSYERTMGGQPDMDTDQAGNETQIDPKVVIAMVVPWSQGPADGIGAYYSEYATIGSGAVDVFQDGTEVTGTWTKTSDTSQITFTDAEGNPIKLNAGQTWITVLASSSEISYQP